MKYGTKFVHTTLSSLVKHVASLFFYAGHCTRATIYNFC